VRGFVASLRQDARFADLEPKESWSATQPFGKLLVKVKREIIRMNHPAIQPAGRPRAGGGRTDGAALAGRRATTTPAAPW
jgi:predicted sulfurtransferase